MRRMKIYDTHNIKITNRYERVKPWKQKEIIKVQWKKCKN